jgi:hypothetical protein
MQMPTASCLYKLNFPFTICILFRPYASIDAEAGAVPLIEKKNLYLVTWCDLFVSPSSTHPPNSCNGKYQGAFFETFRIKERKQTIPKEDNYCSDRDRITLSQI